MQRYYFFLTCANFLAKKFNKISFCNLYFTFQCIAQVVIVNHHRVFLDELLTWTLCSWSSSHFIKQVWTLHFFTSTNQTTASLSISQYAYFIIRNRRSKFPILTFHHLFTFLLPQSSILNLSSILHPILHQLTICEQMQSYIQKFGNIFIFCQILVFLITCLVIWLNSVWEDGWVLLLESILKYNANRHRTTI